MTIELALELTAAEVRRLRPHEVADLRAELRDAMRRLVEMARAFPGLGVDRAVLEAESAQADARLAQQYQRALRKKWRFAVLDGGKEH